MNMVLVFVSVFLTLAEHDPSLGPRPKGSQISGGGASCNVTPSELTAIANGDSSRVETVSNYVNSQACVETSAKVSAQAFSNIRFSSKAPWNFMGDVANALQKSRFETVDSVEKNVSKRVTEAFRVAPLSIKEIPIIAQLAVLSPNLGVMALSNSIQTELINSQGEEIARRLVRLGADRAFVQEAFAQSLEELAATAQVSSVKYALVGLAKSSGINEVLVPTFNRAALGVSKGVSLGSKTYENKARIQMGDSLFLGVKEAVFGPTGLEPGAMSLNEAIAALGITGVPSLDEALAILSRTETQPAMARQLASILNEGVISSSPKTRDLLTRSAEYYYDIAFTLQRSLVLRMDSAWQEASRDIGSYNRLKKEAFMPFAEALMKLTPELVVPEFVAVAVRNGLVGDEIVAELVPKLVTARFRSDRKNFAHIEKAEISRELFLSLASEMNNAFALNRSYLPILNGWVERNGR